MYVLRKIKADDSVKVNFSNRQYDGKTFNYTGKLKVAWLNYRYLIIRVTNIDRKKGKYYFGYSTPEVSKKFIRKEYDMFEKY